MNGFFARVISDIRGWTGDMPVCSSCCWLQRMRSCWIYLLSSWRLCLEWLLTCLFRISYKAFVSKGWWRWWIINNFLGPWLLDFGLNIFSWVGHATILWIRFQHVVQIFSESDSTQAGNYLSCLLRTLLWIIQDVSLEMIDRICPESAISILNSRTFWYNRLGWDRIRDDITSSCNHWVLKPLLSLAISRWQCFWTFFNINRCALWWCHFIFLCWIFRNSGSQMWWIILRIPQI